jgi:competence ComEA-like helix-hairpin-helix protein
LRLFPADTRSFKLEENCLMKWREFVKDYLTFNRKERIGALVITFLMVFVFFLPKIILRISNKSQTQQDTSLVKTVQSLQQNIIDTSNNFPQSKEDENLTTYQFDKNKNSYSEGFSEKGQLFYFDPNTISESGWKKLGLRDKTIITIQNYKSKGGSFKKPEDLQRIYGLHPDEFKRLSPYIRIELTQPNKTEEIVSQKSQTENEKLKNSLPRYSIIDINSADTTDFISLPGIGSKLAARIVNFRDKLGGFYAIDQVSETFGLPDSTYQNIKQYLKLENISVKKININKATVDELKAHPYIKYSLANPIVAYRNEHGPFMKIEDIKQIMVITEDIYKKINPYLSTQ